MHLQGLGDTTPALLATARICDQPTFSMPIDLVQVAASADWWRVVTGKQSQVPPSRTLRINYVHSQKLWKQAADVARPTCWLPVNHILGSQRGRAARQEGQ